MISYQKLGEKPRVFKSITSLNIDEFEQLFQKFVPIAFYGRGDCFNLRASSWAKASSDWPGSRKSTGIL